MASAGKRDSNFHVVSNQSSIQESNGGNDMDKYATKEELAHTKELLSEKIDHLSDVTDTKIDNLSTKINTKINVVIGIIASSVAAILVKMLFF